MKKKDLKTGYIVEMRNGDRSIVLLNTYGGESGLAGPEGWMDLNEYDDDLIDKDKNYNFPDPDDFDIIKVYKSPFYKSLSLYQPESDTKIFDRGQRQRELIVAVDLIEKEYRTNNPDNLSIESFIKVMKDKLESSINGKE